VDRDLKSALDRAYQVVNKIKFNGAMYRRDIGFRATKPLAQQ
jgi:phosphoribosylamine-glycine ligase